MTDKDRLRRLKHLLYQYPRMFPYRDSYLWMEKSAKEWKELLDSGAGKHVPQSIKKQFLRDIPEMLRLAKELNLSPDQFESLRTDTMIERYNIRKPYEQAPVVERKDNKQSKSYGPSGGSNRNKVRYPSKKRSRATWRRFYALFPHLAIADKWDGKTSKRMK